MTITFKQKILLLLGWIVLVMTLLALGLPTLKMLPGTTAPFQAAEATSAASGGFGGGDWLLVLLRGFMAIMLIFLPIYILVSLFSPHGRRRLLAELVIFGSFFLLAMWLSNQEISPGAPEQEVEEQTGMGGFPDGLGSGQAPPTFEAYTPPWMVTLILLGAALFFALSAFLLLRYLSLHRKQDRSFLQGLAGNAQEALVSLDAGTDIKDAVVRCYAQMSQALQEERGIKRSQAMTTYEFEQELLAKGFPPQAVRRITQLFEQVRYGRQPADEQDKQVAIESLTEILRYCRRQA